VLFCPLSPPLISPLPLKIAPQGDSTHFENHWIRARPPLSSWPWLDFVPSRHGILSRFVHRVARDRVTAERTRLCVRSSGVHPHQHRQQREGDVAHFVRGHAMDGGSCMPLAAIDLPHGRRVVRRCFTKWRRPAGEISA